MKKYRAQRILINSPLTRRKEAAAKKLINNQAPKSKK